MAQWSGQFTGNTHLSKVRDREQQLRRAVDAYRSLETQSGIAEQKQAVIRFADQLLSARIRATKARIAALDPRDIDDRTLAESKIQKMLDLGTNGILDEFDASDIRPN